MWAAQRPRTTGGVRARPRFVDEESDDELRVMLRQRRLWPYCLRLENSPILTERARTLRQNTCPALLADLLPPEKLPRLPPRAKSTPQLPKDDLIEELELIKAQLAAAPPAVRYRRAPPPEAEAFKRSRKRHEDWIRRVAEARAAAEAAERALAGLDETKKRVAKTAALEAARKAGISARAEADIAHAATVAADAASRLLEERRNREQRDHRDELAKQFLARQVRVDCPLCGASVVAALLRKHYETCGNRLVPCKNAALGCTTMVRPLNREWHENADHLLRPRPCLAMPGCVVALDEDDVVAPWTAEFWIWRPSAETAARAAFDTASCLYDAWQAALCQVETLEKQKDLEAQGIVEQGRADELIRLHASYCDASVTAQVAKHRTFEFLRSARRLWSGEVEPKWAAMLAAMDATTAVVEEKVEEPPPQEEVSSREKKAQAAKAKRARKRQKRKDKLKAKLKERREEKHGASITDRVVALTAGADCQDVIAASKHCRLLLSTDVGGSLPYETVGIAFPGVSSHALGTEALPRERWTHVAFVASEHRKLSVVVNGHTQKVVLTLPSLVDELHLPMRDLGCDRNEKDGAFRGLLLEARYWATARTVEELRTLAHALPDAGARAQGLIGWWTFEEGQAKWAHDRSECRYRSRILGQPQWVDAYEASNEQEPPTPASREHGVCQIELRRVRLAAKGRELYDYVGCRNAGCQRQILRCRVRFHLEYECEYGPKTCPLCGATYTKSHEDCPVRHERRRLAELHEKNALIVECDQGCGQHVRRVDMERHCALECPMRLTPCSCGLSIPHCRLTLHTRYFCGHPTFVAARTMARQYRQDKDYRRAWAELT